ncbi:glyoxalase elbb [Anaeramoeba ignava]|uniref:Glyoxalase elbb n=1 Tax=Anaeramoeba ignava TaxID=1746090 RepID=A0A9Q0R8A8_ANAIG|nr:glyoxalase elbb [Anaeramoeba ignava]
MFSLSKKVIDSKSPFSRLFSKVAVVLSGCGVYDGSEIQEAVSTLIHLSKNGAEYQCFAPNKEQMHVIDHLKTEPTKESRNVLTESARIVRGDIKPLNDINIKEMDAIIFPGGFGAAKNLSDFATKGKDFVVDTEVEKILKEFHKQKKPIGLICIAPVLGAKVFKDCIVTIGDDPGVKDVIQSVGARHKDLDPEEICVDDKNLIISTPAYMKAQKINVVFDGIGKLVKKVLEFTEKK